jgi:hypothetical protein
MKQLILIMSLALSINAYAQDDKTVTLVVSGQGKTQDEAKQNALRSAIEQAFGTFISSKTEILNDNLVKDEIVSVANGNIKKYYVISEVQIPEGGYATSLKVTVSVTKLTSFVESKGGVIDLRAGEFSYNVKKEELYTNTEFKALQTFITTRLRSQIFYDYTIISKSPKVDGDSYSIELEIGIKANNNLFSFFSDFYNLLKNISLDETNMNFRKESNLTVYKIKVKDGASYYLRNKLSFDLISNIDKFLFLKSGDFNLNTKPRFQVPNAEFLIKSKVVVNNFIIINRKESPNPGVYWSWLPYRYSTGFRVIYDRWSGGEENSIELTDYFLKKIPKQSELNNYMSSVYDGRIDYNLVIGCKLSFTRSDFEKLEFVEVFPILNNYQDGEN